MRLVGFFVHPADRLVRAGELADAAQGSAVEVPEPAVRAAFRAVQNRDNNTTAVGRFSFPEYLIRTYFCTEIAALAPGLVNGEFHGKNLPYSVSAGEKKTYSFGTLRFWPFVFL